MKYGAMCNFSQVPIHTIGIYSAGVDGLDSSIINSRSKIVKSALQARNALELNTIYTK